MQSSECFQLDHISSTQAYEFLKNEWNKFFEKNRINLESQKFYLAIKENNKMKAGAVLSIIGGIGKLEDIFVREECRRKGYGKALINHVEHICKSRNCRKIILETSEMHQEAINFYKKNGFGIIATLPLMYHKKNWYVFCKIITYE